MRAMILTAATFHPNSFRFSFCNWLRGQEDVASAADEMKENSNGMKTKGATAMGSNPRGGRGGGGAKK